MLNLISIGWLVVICYQFYDGRVTDGVGGVDGGAVMGEEGVEEGAEETPLWCASVQDESGWYAASHPDMLWSVAEEVQYPYHKTLGV